jgi:hypothetical protein
MPNRKQRRSADAQQRKHNAAEAPPYELHNIDKSAQYSSQARFLEIAPPGIQFRGLTNVDHITAISFSNHHEELEVVDVEAHTDTDVDGNDYVVPAKMRTEKQQTGFDVIVGIAGQHNAFTFTRLDIAVAYYNELLNMLATLGVPCALKPRIMAPPEPVEEEDDETAIVGTDGKSLEATNDDDPLIDELEDLIDDAAEELVDESPTEH